MWSPSISLYSRSVELTWFILSLSKESTHPLFLAFLYSRKFVAVIVLQIFIISHAIAELNQPEITNKIEWTNLELNIIKSLSLNALKDKPDPSNQVINNPLAIKFGKYLFNDTSLSQNGAVSCATCHLKGKGFTDNKLVAMGARAGIRNTPTLLNVSQQNWFFWDGKKDSLWAQALSSIENPAEHNFSRTEMFHLLTTHPFYNKQYEEVFGEKLLSDELLGIPKIAGPNSHLDGLIRWKKIPKKQKKKINQVVANASKAIASYVSTIKSKSTRFDQFANEVVARGYSSILTNSEKKGLKLFISQKTGCINCHSNPIFSNKDFHNIGTGIPAKDNGRSEVIDAVIHDPFNCLGEFSDAKPEQCLELKYTKKDRHALSGSFKTPTLRSISKTAPYMHDGRYKNLQEVLKHYANITKNKALETDLPIMNINKEEQDDLISFLLTL